MRNVGTKKKGAGKSAPGAKPKGEKQSASGVEITIKAATAELSQHIQLVAEARRDVLMILTDLLPELEPREHGLRADPNIEAAVVRYARAHDFNDACAGSLIFCLGIAAKIMIEWPAMIREKTLALLIEKTNDLVQKRSDVQAGADRFASICEGLDVKTRFIILVGQELSSLGGGNIECFSDVWYAIRDQGQQVEKLIAEAKSSELLQDDDMRFLYDNYMLADAINSAQ